MRGLLRDGASLSPSTVGRLQRKWDGGREAWGTQQIDGFEPVYPCVDGVYVKAGLAEDEAALPVAIAGCSDGQRELVALAAGHREPDAAWLGVRREI